MSNTKNFSITVSGLLPYSKYSYYFTGAGANWPTILTPGSGSFSTNRGTSKIIKTKVHFCLSTGICPSSSPEVLDYSITECISNPTGLYSNLNLSLREYDSNEEIFNDTYEILCDDCLPKPILSMATSAQISASNTYSILAIASGLTPKQKYNYVFTGVDANWPTTLSSATGQFTAKDPTENINCNLTFCPTTGMCQTENKTVLNYSLDSNCIFGNVLPYSKVRLTLTPVDCGASNVFTDALNVTCNNCLPRLSIDTPESITLNSPNANLYTLSSTVSGLRRDETYNYVYNVVSSNWPTIISPISGSFTATGATKQLSSKMMFCSPTGICPNGTEGLLSYTLDEYSNKLLKQNLLSTSIKLTVDPSTCDIPSKTSDEFVLNCSGCLPTYTYATLNFADTPMLTVDSDCCTGVKAVTVNVSGAVPGTRYDYEFGSASEYITFTPSTGMVYFGSNGAGFVNTVLGMNLVTGQEVIINCKIKHIDTGIESTDFLAIKCGNLCST